MRIYTCLSLLRRAKDLGMAALETQLRSLSTYDFSPSQGQCQGLSSLHVQDAPVMLLDEPDSALDFLNRHMVLGKIRDLIKNENRAGLITLHDPNFAMAYCDRLLLLQNGIVGAELDMRTASADEVKQKLSLIYGDIELLPYQESYLMTKAK